MIPFEVHPWQLSCGEVVPVQVLDLRDGDTFRRGRLPGALSVPWERFQADALGLVVAGQPTLIVDAGGARAAEMAMWLRARGLSAGYLSGGMSHWTGSLERG